jgi:biotin carboxyl carrier protein
MNRTQNFADVRRTVAPGASSTTLSTRSGKCNAYCAAGLVVAVFGVEGEAVRRNEPVVLIEAMKMEIPIGPAVDGTVKTIHVSVGDLIGARQVLFELS